MRHLKKLGQLLAALSCAATAIMAAPGIAAAADLGDPKMHAAAAGTTSSTRAGDGSKFTVTGHSLECEVAGSNNGPFAQSCTMTFELTAKDCNASTGFGFGHLNTDRGVIDVELIAAFSGGTFDAEGALLPVAGQDVALAHFSIHGTADCNNLNHGQGVFTGTVTYMYVSI